MGIDTVCTRTMPDATVVVETFGAVEGAAVDELRQTLIEVLMRRRPPRVVVDITATQVVDSVALGTLTAAAETAEDLAIEFAVVGSASAAARVVGLQNECIVDTTP